MTDSDRIAIVNARVWTGNPRRPWAEAILINDDRLELVGSSAEARKRIVAPTRVIDARGMLVLPARADAAQHADDVQLVDAAHGMVRGGLPSGARALENGAPANLVMLDRDITRAQPGDVGEAKIVLHIAAGRVVIDRPGQV